MYKILDDNKLNASIRSFVSRKFDKYDVPVMPSQAKNGISSRLMQHDDTATDCIAGDYLWHGDTSFAN